ncbi:MAG: hypothetical protein HY286_17240 [Planctomycetes bacterium]|nr:hypothetical protein [Planctomycetota bacterium]
MHVQFQRRSITIGIFCVVFTIGTIIIICIISKDSVVAGDSKGIEFTIDHPSGSSPSGSTESASRMPISENKTSGLDVSTPGSGDTTPVQRLPLFINDTPLANGRYRDGIHRSTYPSGHVHSEEIWRNGNREGHAVYYDDATGNKLSEGNYLGGYMEGEWATYSANGAITEKGMYKQNIRCGWWTFWNWEGLVDSEKSGFYENNRRVH